MWSPASACIYSLGNPIDYKNMILSLRVGMEKPRDELLAKLVELQYERNDMNFIRNKFRVRGDVIEVFPAYSGENAIRIELFGDEIDRISTSTPPRGAAFHAPACGHLSRLRTTSFRRNR